MAHCGGFGAGHCLLFLTVTFKIEKSAFKKLRPALNSALKQEITTCTSMCTYMRKCVRVYIMLLQNLLTYHLQAPGRQQKATAVTTALVHLPRNTHCLLFQSFSSASNYLLTAFNLLENLNTNRRPDCKLRTSSVKWNKSVVWTCSLVLK